MEFMTLSPRKRSMAMVAGSFYIPKANPKKPRGEDAHFFDVGSQVIGVADGVGGWAKRGIDAGEYARELMRNAACAVEDLQPRDVEPKKVLTEAFLNTEAEGSSTACIVSLSGDLLKAANLGDSGFSVIRRGKTLFQSPVQHHGFNFPYQLGSAKGDSPYEAEELVVGVEVGDVVIAGTDGLFDNVFPEDIEAVVDEVLHAEEEGRKSMETLAWRLARVARKKSLEKDTASPFEVGACAAGLVHFGGKYI